MGGGYKVRLSNKQSSRSLELLGYHTISKNHAKIVDYVQKMEKIIYLLNLNNTLHPL
jgi:hypothetical protein